MYMCIDPPEYVLTLKHIKKIVVAMSLVGSLSGMPVPIGAKTWVGGGDYFYDRMRVG